MLRRLLTALRGGINEAAEAAADTQALRILDQQIRDAEGSLDKAQRDLAGLMGRAKLSRDNVAELDAKFERDWATGQKAVAANREDLAREVADRLAQLDAERTARRTEAEALTRQEETLRATVERIRNSIASMKREVETVKVTDSVQRAQSAIVAHGSGAASNLNSAAASLQRLKERQVGRQAEFDASERLQDLKSGGDLDKRLASAGLLEGPSDASGMLARLKGGGPSALSGPSSAGALPAPGSDKAQG